jgi:O-antigen/teichoic acid export membrane protein
LRSLTVHELGLAENGLYQPAQTMTSVIFAQLAGALTLVLLPRLAYELLHNAEQAKRTLNSGAESAVVLAVPLCLLAAAFAEVFVLVFFDRDFLSAASVVAVQSTAELPRLVAYVLGAVLIPAGLVGSWLVSSILGNAVRLLVALLLFDAMGLYALALGIVAMWVVTLVWTAVVLNRHLGWRPTPRLTRLALPAPAVVVAGVLMSQENAAWTAGAVALGAAWLALFGRREIRIVLAVRGIGASPSP